MAFHKRKHTSRVSRVTVVNTKSARRKQAQNRKIARIAKRVAVKVSQTVPEKKIRPLICEFANTFGLSAASVDGNNLAAGNQDFALLEAPLQWMIPEDTPGVTQTQNTFVGDSFRLKAIRLKYWIGYTTASTEDIYYSVSIFWHRLYVNTTGTAWPTYSPQLQPIDTTFGTDQNPFFKPTTIVAGSGAWYPMLADLNPQTCVPVYNKLFKINQNTITVEKSIVWKKTLRWKKIGKLMKWSRQQIADPAATDQGLLYRGLQLYVMLRVFEPRTGGGLNTINFMPYHKIYFTDV